MHGVDPIIRDLAVILGVAGFVTLLFQYIRQPVVLGYLVAGIIVGPHIVTQHQGHRRARCYLPDVFAGAGV
jgi:Kef-type K+ transport system membrane component KefB